MNKHLDRVKRIGRVQRQLADLAQWRLAGLERAEAALVESQRQMIEAIGRDEGYCGPLAAVVARHVRGIERQIESAAASRQLQTDAARVQGGRTKLADQAVIAADLIHRAQRERKDLAELIERSLGAAKTSSG